jgi:hypothetical protein
MYKYAGPVRAVTEWLPEAEKEEKRSNLTEEANLPTDACLVAWDAWTDAHACTHGTLADCPGALSKSKSNE